MSANTLMTWGLVAALAVIDAIWLQAEGMSLAPGILLPTLLPIIFTAALAWFYTNVRPDPRIATLSHMVAASLAFTAVSMVLSYIMVRLNRPLIDSYLIGTDRFFAIDRPAMYQAVTALPALHIGLKIIYLCLVPQMIFLLLFLNFRGAFERAWELQWLFFILCLSCIVVSGLWPAAGAFGAFQIQVDEPYVKEFNALRDGTLKIIGNRGVQGIIQFPSLHTALAILYIYIARGQPVLFPLLFLLNLLIIVSTPVIGGHHFADLAGGGVLACTVILASRVFYRRIEA